jgi:hypothetical protein
LDRYKYPKKTFLELFSSISWGLCTDTKGKKVVLFGLSTDPKGEKLKFLFFEYSLSVPVLNPKSVTFSHLVPVQRPQEIERKSSKVAFFWYLPYSNYLIFGPEKF